MALNKVNFENSLREIMDTEYSGFKEFPQEETDFINALADAVDKMTSSIAPSSTTASPALIAMRGALSQVSEMNNAVAKIQDGFAAYAGALAGGMVGQNHGGGTVTIATPPSARISIQSLEDIGLNEGSAEEVIKEFSTIAENWFKTGMTTVMIGNTTSTGPNWS